MKFPIMVLALVAMASCYDEFNKGDEAADRCRVTRNNADDGVIVVCDGSDPVEVTNGAPGETGSQGGSGPKGDDGAPGTNGEAGDDGDPGRDGDDGDPGPVGQQGPVGADGVDGSDGAQGPAGADGQPGRDGADGQDGADGADGTNCFDLVGDADNNGVVDSWDCVWAAICPVPADQVGDVDNNGVVDLDDCRELLRGPAGAQGPRGPAGADGADGADGQPGRDGADGQDGADGNAGAQGAPGPAGPDGQNGQDGAPGCGWECALLGGLRCNAGVAQECRQDGDVDICGEWVNKPACQQGQICNNGRCQAVPPETCNGLDDDGDGLVDEEPTSDEGGECPALCLVGFNVCLGGRLDCAVRVPPQPNPQQESCDGIDNDCDGQTDEGVADLDGDRICDALDGDVDGDTVNNPQDACVREFGDALLNGCPCNQQRACPQGRVCNARGTCDAAPPPPPPVCNPACPAGQICGVGNVCHFDGIVVEWRMPAGTQTTQISLPGYWGVNVVRGASDGPDGRLLCDPQDQAPPADEECWRDLETARDPAGNVVAITANLTVPRGSTLEFNVNFENVAPFWVCTGTNTVTGTFARTSSPESAALARTAVNNRQGGCNFRVTRPAPPP